MIPETPNLGYFAATYLQRKFCDRTDAELMQIWNAAYNWICKHVGSDHFDPKPHPMLIAAMFLYMQHICESEPQMKAAHLFSAHELLSIFP